MDGRTANTPTHASASDVPDVALMPKKLVLVLWSDVAPLKPSEGLQQSRTQLHSRSSYATERGNLLHSSPSIYYGGEWVFNLIKR